jgi:hypothetical protein
VSKFRLKEFYEIGPRVGVGNFFFPTFSVDDEVKNIVKEQGPNGKEAAVKKAQDGSTYPG